jgi:hypothetical protein
VACALFHHEKNSHKRKTTKIEIKYTKATNSVETMSIQQYVTYLTQYKVLLCRQCQYYIVPGGIQRHLIDFHQSIPFMIRQNIIEFGSQLDLIDPSLMQINKGLNEYVKGLKVYKNGFRCSYTGCMFSCTTESSMVKHGRITHGWIISQGNQWIVTDIQSFFSGANKR